MENILRSSRNTGWTTVAVNDSNNMSRQVYLKLLLPQIPVIKPSNWIPMHFVLDEPGWCTGQSIIHNITTVDPVYFTFGRHLKRRRTLRRGWSILALCQYCLTLSTPAVPNCCCLKGSAPYWSDPCTIFIFWHSGTLALSPERQSARMSKIKNGGLGQYGKV